MWWKILQSLPQPLLIDWEPKCHHPGNLNTSSYTMARLSGVGRDEIMNLIKVVTVPFQGWAPSIGEVLIFHVPQCYTFTRAPCTLGNKHAFEGFLPSGLQEGASCGGEEKCLERYWMESVLVLNLLLWNYMYNTFFFCETVENQFSVQITCGLYAWKCNISGAVKSFPV